MIAGIGYNWFSKPIYPTALLLKSEYFNTKLVANNIDKLNLLCEEKERDGLAKVLDLSGEVATNIFSFDYSYN